MFRVLFVFEHAKLFVAEWIALDTKVSPTVPLTDPKVPAVVNQETRSASVAGRGPSRLGIE